MCYIFLSALNTYTTCNSCPDPIPSSYLPPASSYPSPLTSVGSPWSSLSALKIRLLNSLRPLSDPWRNRLHHVFETSFSLDYLTKDFFIFSYLIPQSKIVLRLEIKLDITPRSVCIPGSHKVSKKLSSKITVVRFYFLPEVFITYRVMMY